MQGSSGFGPVERDASVGGGPLSIDGTIYAKGIGLNAIGSVWMTIR